MKLGGKAFFCFTVSGFLQHRVGDRRSWGTSRAQSQQRPGLDEGSPGGPPGPAEAQGPAPPAGFLQLRGDSRSFGTHWRLPLTGRFCPQSTGWGQQGLSKDRAAILTGCCWRFSHSSSACRNSAARREKGDQLSHCTARPAQGAQHHPVLPERGLCQPRAVLPCRKHPWLQQRAWAGTFPGHPSHHGCCHSSVTPCLLPLLRMHPSPLPSDTDSPLRGLSEGLLEVSGCEDETGWGDVSQCSSAWEARAARLNHASPEEGSLVRGMSPCPSCLSGTGAAELPHQPTHTLQALQGATRLEDVPAHTNPTPSAGSPIGNANLPGFRLLP